MHEYIEIQFRRRGKPFGIKRQVSDGFEFKEADPPTRTIDIGFVPFGDGTKYRLMRIRQLKGWKSAEFRLRVSVEEGSLVIRGDDAYSLPEGFYNITANVSGAKVKKQPRRVEVVHDDHGVVTVDLELEERTIEVDLTDADQKILDVLTASTIDAQPGIAWVGDGKIRPTRRACALNLLANLRVFPSLSAPLLTDVICLFTALDDRCYAIVRTAFYERVSNLSEHHDRVYAEGHPHAEIHNLLIQAICDLDKKAKGVFDKKGLLSFRAEGTPSLQLVIATPTNMYSHHFADLDLDLGNPLQDVAGLVIHIGELLDGAPTNHLDLRQKLAKGKAKPYLYYTVTSPAK